eukprot:scaffold58625_cov59-Phaeocystis_antarctica.AAC.3
MVGVRVRARVRVTPEDAQQRRADVPGRAALYLRLGQVERVQEVAREQRARRAGRGVDERLERRARHCRLGVDSARPATARASPSGTGRGAKTGRSRARPARPYRGDLDAPGRGAKSGPDAMLTSVRRPTQHALA